MGEEVQRATAAVDAFPEEFRITELGLLPRQWHVVPFMKAVVDPTVKVNKVQKRHYQTTGRFPIIDQGKSTIAGYWDDQTDVYQGPLPVIVFGDHTRIFKFVETPFVCGADGVKLLSPNTSKFDPAFLFFTLLNLDIPDRGYNRHFRLLREQQLPLPPLGEQRAIASALRAVQQAKEATEQVIDAVGELKKSLMRYLFMYGPVPVSETGKVLLRDTQAGSVPEHWTVMALGQVVESSFSGGTPSTKVADYWNGDIPWITSAAIAEEDVILQKHQRFITDLGLSKSAAKMAPKDAVIVGTRVGIGKAVVAPSSVAMNQDLTALVLDTRRVEPTFLAYLFKTDAIQRSMQLLARGTTIKGVPRNDLLDLLIPLPPLNKQHAITRILRLVDGRLVAERNKKQALDALFNTLLLNLMEGKVRLPEFAGGE